MSILDQIDEVVKASEEISDEMIEARAREHGLARVPRNVTEVVDILFGHIDPKGGRPYLQDEVSEWENPQPAVTPDAALISRLSRPDREEIEELRYIYEVKTRIDYERFVRSTRGLTSEDRREAAWAWRMEAHEILEIYKNRRRFSERTHVRLMLEVERAYDQAIVVLPGERIPAGPDEEVVQESGRMWSLRRRPAPPGRRGSPSRWWWNNRA